MNPIVCRLCFTVIIFMLNANMCFSLSVEEIINNLTEVMNNKMDTFQSDVEQIIYVSDMESSQSMKGSITLKKPNKIYLNYTEPFNQLVISNGKTIWIYFPNMKQVIVQDISETKNKEYFLFQFNYLVDSIKNKFKMKILKEEELDGKEAVVIELTPKDENAEFIKINGWFDKKRWLPLSFSVYYNEISNISITFKNSKLNPDIKSDIFEFKIPEGVEVISSLLK